MEYSKERFNISMKYFVNDPHNISIYEILDFLEKLDESVIHPISKRDYFQSYEVIAQRFLNNGKSIYCKNEYYYLVGLAVVYADSFYYELAFETYIGVIGDYHGCGIEKELITREIKLCKDLSMKGNFD